jgi:hypothetical protein
MSREEQVRTLLKFAFAADTMEHVVFSSGKRVQIYTSGTNPVKEQSHQKNKSNVLTIFISAVSLFILYK